MAILDDLLDVPADPSRGFIALGGDSIRAMQAAARARRQLGVRLQADALLSAESMEQAIAKATAPESADEVADDLSRPPDAASFGQRQLWSVDALADQPGLYSIASAVHFAGELEVEKLAAAVRATLVAHGSLRTIFRESDQGLIRMVLPHDSMELSRYDFRDRPADGEAAYRQLAAGAACAPLSLECGPVLRAAFVRRRDDLCSLVLVAHHIALDGWSLGLICAEITSRYRAALEEREPTQLPTEPFETFVEAEARERRARAGRDTRWWRDYLAGAPMKLTLSSDMERPPLQSFSGARLNFEPVDPERLRAVARGHAVTPFTLLLAAFALCIHRQTAQRDFLIGIPLAGRNRPELQDVVGFCAKLLPVRIFVGDHREHFSRFARRLQTSVSLVVEHASVDLPDLVRELSLPGDPSRHPLVQVVFSNDDDLVASGPVGAGICLDLEDLDTNSSPVDLTLFIKSLRSPPHASVEYATAVISEADVSRLAASYAAILALILEDPQRSLDDLVGGDRRVSGGVA